MACIQAMAYWLMETEMLLPRSSMGSVEVVASVDLVVLLGLVVVIPFMDVEVVCVIVGVVGALMAWRIIVSSALMTKALGVTA